MKSVGILSFFPAFNPPRSGGELRLHHIAMHLAASGFDLEMASPTYGDAQEETVRHAERFAERRFPKTGVYNWWHRFMDKAAGFAECSGLVCSLACRKHERLRAEAERLAACADIFTQESPFLVPLIPRSRKRGQILVYNSYNVEAKLARAMFGNRPAGRLASRRIAALERSLLREADLVLACSDEDAEGFVQDFGADRTKIVVVPNGVDAEAIRPATPEQRAAARQLLGLSNARPSAFFLGSYHPPNIDAVDVIIHRLAPALPEADFLVAGKVCDAFRDRAVPENVKLLGLVDEAHKNALLHGPEVALNPMAGGSGTNLKMLDYLSAGQAVLSTVVGARGLALDHRRHALVVKEEGLVDGLGELFADSTLRELLGREGRRHVEQRFSWRGIGERVADLYSLKTGRRILILNDYAVLPAETGGQVRVESVAHRLAAEGMAVTLLTLTNEDQGRRIQQHPRIEELNIPRTRLHRAAGGLLSNLVGCSADDVSALLLTRMLTRDFRRALRREARSAEAVMLSHPYMETAMHGIEGPRLYYDSHNTEYTLKQKLYKGTAPARFAIGRVRRAEIDAARRSAATFCVSEENRRDLSGLVEDLERRSWVAPNGVDCGRVRLRTPEEKRALRRKVGFGREFVAVFLGSGHPPNAEAARLIIEQVARDHPRVLFLLVGSVCGWFWSTHLPGNVVLMGTVSTGVKDFLLQTADFALNPMLTGGGTSLKLFDYMAAGLPVLSTQVGARGLDDESMRGVVLLDPGDFSRGLRDLLGDPDRCAALAAQSRRNAETKFDWGVTLQHMANVIVRNGA